MKFRADEISKKVYDFIRFYRRGCEQVNKSQFMVRKFFNVNRKFRFVMQIFLLEIIKIKLATDLLKMLILCR